MMKIATTMGTAAVLTFAILSGCASGQMNRNAVFTRSSPTSLVMFGVDLQTDYKAPDFVFAQYDPSTGKTDSSRFYHATTTLDQLTGDQKLSTYLTGRDRRPVRHVYFVITLPPGEWFLLRVSGVHQNSDGSTTTTTTVLSEGTILISSHPGTALYVGDFVLTARYGENLLLTPASRDVDAAQAELDTFRGVRVELFDEEAQIRPFKCATGRVLPRRECDPTEIVMSQ